MVQESTTKVGSMIVALALLGMVGLSVAPSAQAEETSLGEAEEGGPCIKVSTDPPAVGISPQDCKPSTVHNVTFEP